MPVAAVGLDALARAPGVLESLAPLTSRSLMMERHVGRIDRPEIGLAFTLVLVRRGALLNAR